MKNFYLLLSGILLMMLVSCAQAEIATVTDEPYGSIEETYFEFYNSIQQNLNDELCQIGANSTRFNVDESVVGTILQMTKNELKTFVSSEQRALAESRQDSIFSKFFTYYSDEVIY